MKELLSWLALCPSHSPYQSGDLQHFFWNDSLDGNGGKGEMGSITLGVKMSLQWFCGSKESKESYLCIIGNPQYYHGEMQTLSINVLILSSCFWSGNSRDTLKIVTETLFRKKRNYSKKYLEKVKSAINERDEEQGGNSLRGESAATLLLCPTVLPGHSWILGWDWWG